MRTRLLGTDAPDCSSVYEYLILLLNNVLMDTNAGAYLYMMRAMHILRTLLLQHNINKNIDTVYQRHKL